MQYALTYHEPESEFTKRDNPETAPAYWGAWRSYMGSIAEAGIFVTGAGLQLPHTASTLRMSDGKRVVQDGPYADTKEQLGGFCIIDVPDLDTALDWAAKAPCASSGSIEVRPVLPPPSE